MIAWEQLNGLLLSIVPLLSTRLQCPGLFLLFPKVAAIELESMQRRSVRSAASQRVSRARQHHSGGTAEQGEPATLQCRVSSSEPGDPSHPSRSCRETTSRDSVPKHSTSDGASRWSTQMKTVADATEAAHRAESRWDGRQPRKNTPRRSRRATGMILNTVSTTVEQASESMEAVETTERAEKRDLDLRREREPVQLPLDISVHAAVSVRQPGPSHMGADDSAAEVRDASLHQTGHQYSVQSTLLFDNAKRTGTLPERTLEAIGRRRDQIPPQAPLSMTDIDYTGHSAVEATDDNKAEQTETALCNTGVDIAALLEQTTSWVRLQLGPTLPLTCQYLPLHGTAKMGRIEKMASGRFRLVLGGGNSGEQEADPGAVPTEYVYWLEQGKRVLHPMRWLRLSREKRSHVEEALQSAGLDRLQRLDEEDEIDLEHIGRLRTHVVIQEPRTLIAVPDMEQLYGAGSFPNGLL